MKTKLLLAAILLAMFGSAFSCGKREECEPFIQIGIGSLYGDGKEGISKQDIIIRTQEEWEDLKTAMGNDFSEIDIDFDSYQIIAVFDEIRGSGSWSISVTCIREYSDNVVVTIMIVSKGRGGIVPAIMYQPYHIIKIPVTTKNIEFRYI